MEYISDVKVTTVTEIRTFLRYQDNRNGADKEQIYERIENELGIFYINLFNKNIKFFKNDPYFTILENLYQANK